MVTGLHHDAHQLFVLALKLFYMLLLSLIMLLEFFDPPRQVLNW